MSDTTSDAGDLYDVVLGQRRYALVRDGQIVFLSYHEAQPEGWLPVVHQDSEPFDNSKHWRLKSIATIEADRVVVTFPVIPQERV